MAVPNLSLGLFADSLVLHLVLKNLSSEASITPSFVPYWRICNLCPLPAPTQQQL